MNAARKVVFSQTIRPPTGRNTSVASGDLGAEIEKLKQDGDGYIVAHGGIGFWRSLIRLRPDRRIPPDRSSPTWQARAPGCSTTWGNHARLELASATAFGNGVTELAFRRVR